MRAEQKRYLNRMADRKLIRKILAVGKKFDINNNGIYDARSGCVNFWCSPEDKPVYWHDDIRKGGLNYPRDYVGALEWDYKDEDTFILYVNAAPYEMERKLHNRVNNEQMESILDWVEEKAKELLRFAEVHEEHLGLECPFCDFVLPQESLLNEIIKHIADIHNRRVQACCLTNPVVLTIDGKKHILQVHTDMGV